MGVLEALIKITQNDIVDFETAQNALLKELKMFLAWYKKKVLELKNSKAQNKDFDEIILLKDFITDLWNEILSKELQSSYTCSVLEKMLNRFVIQTQETLYLIGHDKGLSAISNVRLFIEALAITNYVMTNGEKEAERFVDYSYYQETLVEKKELDPKFIEKYGDKIKNSFYSIPYGWCSEEKMTGEKLVKKLNSNALVDYYRLTCNYIHASPYSLIHISDAKNPFFPIPAETLIRIIKIALFQFITYVLDFTLSDEQKHPYLVLLKMIVPDLLKIDGEE